MKVRTFTIEPNIPTRMAALVEMAKNLWWCWNPDAIALFRRMSEEKFSASHHNPVKMLGMLTQKEIDDLHADGGFLAHMDRVHVAFQSYINEGSWYQQKHGKTGGPIFAYFSAEFGLHESLPIYSGGLGVLAGDHLKSASDLAVPLAAVGLLYQQGYFRQYLNSDGWQQERYPENDFNTMVCQPELAKTGEPLLVEVEYPGRIVHSRIWRVQVGRVPLYLLDTNIPQNSPEDREITAQLYGGDQDMRVRQELLLGVGGMRALAKVGIEPKVCHMNEGHSAFLALERVATTMERLGVDFATAREVVASGCVFTTHTPVPAGNDMFPPFLVERYLHPLMERLKISKDEMLSLGRQVPSDNTEPFCMTVLALRLANHANGVSELHGRVSRKMWQKIWPDLPLDEVPIEHITNGIHTRSMLSSEISDLYDRYFGPDWDRRPADHSVWAKADRIPDSELWRTHERRRERLVAYSRRKLQDQLRNRGASIREISAAGEVLDPGALTIGFARRFATYKRGDLLFRDANRLARIVNSANRPVQFIFAGKAHPRDNGGKELIQRIAHMTRDDRFRRRVVFLEDYDIAVARYLVQGVDVWLNNPRRPLEASGTSGMKGPINGGLNMSILDGWWCEGYNGDNGWAIGRGEEYHDLEHQDDIESRQIYELLEEEIVPLFYDRGGDGLPREWIWRMKQSIMSIGPAFNTNRMVEEYVNRFYVPSYKCYETLASGKAEAGRELAHWLQRVRHAWGNIRVEEVRSESNGNPVMVGGKFRLTARVHLGPLTPQDVAVEIYHGDLDSKGHIQTGAVATMKPVTPTATGGLVSYVGDVDCDRSGKRGYAVRVRPVHRLLPRRFEPGLLHWA